jgi:hypothetical protein
VNIIFEIKNKEQLEIYSALSVLVQKHPNDSSKALEVRAVMLNGIVISTPAGWTATIHSPVKRVYLVTGTPEKEGGDE